LKRLFFKIKDYFAKEKKVRKYSDDEEIMSPTKKYENIMGTDFYTS
jgi:hypothetical protein